MQHLPHSISAYTGDQHQPHPPLQLKAISTHPEEREKHPGSTVFASVFFYGDGGNWGMTPSSPENNKIIIKKGVQAKNPHNSMTSSTKL